VDHFDRRVFIEVSGGKMGLPVIPIPATNAAWLDEVRLAFADASKALPFQKLLGNKANSAFFPVLASSVQRPACARNTAVFRVRVITSVSRLNFQHWKPFRRVPNGKTKYDRTICSMCRNQLADGCA
jgi:hypothetical protein